MIEGQRVARDYCCERPEEQCECVRRTLSFGRADGCCELSALWWLSACSWRSPALVSGRPRSIAQAGIILSLLAGFARDSLDSTHRPSTLSLGCPYPHSWWRGICGTVIAAVTSEGPLFALLTALVFGGAVISGQAPTELRWGGDAEGGAPFVEADPNDPSRVVGFDVDIAALVARGLGRTPRFIQTGFTTLDASVARGDFDIGLSGIEDSAARRARLAVTIPYYQFREILTVRDADRATLSHARRPSRPPRRDARRHARL